jgi:hypothetical protein
MKRLRRSSEAEVISEFLKSEFYHEEFHADRENFQLLVMDAELSSARDNALRRALLFRRRGHMWRELPSDTQWWEVELESRDLRYVRVFPRAQWRRIAAESFLLCDIVSRVRHEHFSGRTGEFIGQIERLSHQLRQQTDRSTVLLIGVDDHNPLTILEGNHRLTAGLLAGSAVFRHQFRALCGFSANMPSCCWYETNLRNLWRYARHRLRNLYYDRDADVNRVLRETSRIEVTPIEGGISSLESGMSPVRAGKIAGGSK